MTFHISGCKHDTKLILVSILTFSRSRISKMLKTIPWPWRLILEFKVTHIHCMTFINSDCTYTWCWLDLSVDSNIFKVEDLRKPKINHLTLMFDLENLGQTFFCMTFHISGCKHDTKSILVSILTFSRSKISKIIKTNTWLTWPYRLTLKLKVIHFFLYDLAYLRLCACYLLDLGVESNILKVEDRKKSIFGYLTLMIDLDFQGQTTFLLNLYYFQGQSLYIHYLFLIFWVPRPRLC